MSLPVSLSTCTIQGTYVDLNGNPVRGSLIFKPQTILKELALNVILIPVAIVKELDANGSVNIVLPVTSDPDVTPQPFIYEITENFSGGRTFAVALPLSLAGTTVNLADLLPALPSAQASNFISVDQYLALQARYSDANNTRVIVIDAEDYEENAEIYAQLAALAADEISQFTTQSLMLMGI